MPVLQIVEFGVVPILLGWAFVVVALTPGRLPYVRTRRSARAGVWAGPTLVVVLALWFPPDAAQDTAEITRIHPWGAVLGLAAGLAAPIVVRRAQSQALEQLNPDEPDARPKPPPSTVRQRLGAVRAVFKKSLAEHWEGRPGQKLVKWAAGRSWVAVLTLVLSTSSAGAGYLYAVWSPGREFTASAVLCGVLGVLVTIVLKPRMSIEFRRPFFQL